MIKEEFMKQGKNTINAVGTLVTNNIKVSEDGKVAKGEVVIECAIEDEINEFRFNVYAQDSFKNFGNIEEASELPDRATALNPDMAAKVRIIGSLELNEYQSKGDVISFNRNRTIVINQTERDTQDQFMVEVGGIISDKRTEGEELFVDMLCVGYENEIMEIKDGIRVPEQFKEDVNKLYEVGDTAVITYSPRRSVVVEEASSVAFGKVMSNESFNEENVLVGGYPPIKNGEEYSEEEVEKIKKLRKQQYAELEAQIAPTGGFGAGSSGGTGGFGTSSSDSPFLK